MKLLYQFLSFPFLYRIQTCIRYGFPFSSQIFRLASFVATIIWGAWGRIHSSHFLHFQELTIPPSPFLPWWKTPMLPDFFAFFHTLIYTWKKLWKRIFRTTTKKARCRLDPLPTLEKSFTRLHCVFFIQCTKNFLAYFLTYQADKKPIYAQCTNAPKIRLSHCGRSHRNTPRNDTKKSFFIDDFNKHFLPQFLAVFHAWKQAKNKP